MLAGIVVSSVLGGFAGLACAMTQGQGLIQTFLAYQIGGMLAMTAFVTSARALMAGADGHGGIAARR